MDAISETWNRAGAIRFVGWQSCRSGADSRSVRVATEQCPNPVKGCSRARVGYTSVVSANEQGKPSMILQFDFDKRVCNGPNDRKCCANNLPYCIRALGVHEFGHILGLVHEDRATDLTTEERQLRRELCRGIKHSGPRGRLITAWDDKSVMNYCNRSWKDAGVVGLSQCDIAAVQLLYGRGEAHKATCTPRPLP